MKDTLKITFVILAGLLLGCKSSDKASSLNPELKSGLDNFVFPEKDLSGNEARLQDGRFVGDHLTVDALKSATADLDGDGETDGVVVVFVNSGGSGNFRHLCLLMNRDRNLLCTDEVFLGDRIRITELIADGNLVTVSYLDRPPSASYAAEPNIEKKASYRVRNNHLEKQDE